MQLHEHKNEFAELVRRTAEWRDVSFDAVVKDYFIVRLLNNLQNSDYAGDMLFKGGTSLSKCYNVIHRFSEDIDLTFLPKTPIASPKARKKALKNAVDQMTAGFSHIETHGDQTGPNNRVASVYFDSGLVSETPENDKIKLEIGSVVNYGASEALSAKSYIYEFLEAHNRQDLISKFGLQQVSLYVLPLEITFLEKLYAIKTHVHQGTIGAKSRHIYDIAQLYNHPRIRRFLSDPEQYFKYLSMVRKQSSAYNAKRGIDVQFDLKDPYNFKSWKDALTTLARSGYNDVLARLVFGGDHPSFDEAVSVLEKIDDLLKELETLQIRNANRNKHCIPLKNQIESADSRLTHQDLNQDSPIKGPER